jgi:hypothetical protein
MDSWLRSEEALPVLISPSFGHSIIDAFRLGSGKWPKTLNFRGSAVDMP